MVRWVCSVRLWLRPLLCARAKQLKDIISWAPILSIHCEMFIIFSLKRNIMITGFSTIKIAYLFPNLSKFFICNYNSFSKYPKIHWTFFSFLFLSFQWNWCKIQKVTNKCIFSSCFTFDKVSVSSYMPHFFKLWFKENTYFGVSIATPKPD